MPEQVKYRLLEISPESVEFSDANPRGKTPDEIAEDDTFEQLKDSIYKYGVLVPIVVHELPESPSGKRYRLVSWFTVNWNSGGLSWRIHRHRLSIGDMSDYWVVAAAVQGAA